MLAMMLTMVMRMMLVFMMLHTMTTPTKAMMMKHGANIGTAKGIVEVLIINNSTTATTFLLLNHADCDGDHGDGKDGNAIPSECSTLPSNIFQLE